MSKSKTRYGQKGLRIPSPTGGSIKAGELNTFDPYVLPNQRIQRRLAKKALAQAVKNEKKP